MIISFPPIFPHSPCILHVIAACHKCVNSRRKPIYTFVTCCYDMQYAWGMWKNGRALERYDHLYSALHLFICLFDC